MSVSYLFPGQGSQFSGMGKALYDHSDHAKERFSEAGRILAFDIGEVMFHGSPADLTRTDVTQPAIFLHSVILAEVLGAKSNAKFAAGHSLGEFSALTAMGALSFEDGLTLVKVRANAMQRACEQNPGTMAAVIGLDDEKVEEVCDGIQGIVKPANYNTLGQVVISGEVNAVKQAEQALKDAGARMVKQLAVGGAFHSQLMQPAREELAEAINNIELKEPACPIYQNFDGQAHTDPTSIKSNLIAQLTGAVKWSQSIQKMLEDGAGDFVELGPGRVLSGMMKRIDRNANVEAKDAPESE